MENESQKYKFIVIDTNTNEANVFNSYNKVSEFISNICENNISHNHTRNRLQNENGFFYFEYLLVKKLIW